MRVVAREGRTVLFVSHNMGAVRQFCTQAITLENGRSQWWGSRVEDAVSQYLSTARIGASEWHRSKASASTGLSFEIDSLRITDQRGELLVGASPATEDLFIEITGDVHDAHPALCVGFAMYGENEAPLLWSYQTDADESCRPILKKGRNALRARLPHGWLNEGRYRVDFLCGLHGIEWISAPRSNAPSVEFEIQGMAGNSSFRLQRRPVLLAPVLEWMSGAEDFSKELAPSAQGGQKI
jgi:lipopolysaccharide transport system ATP-binding protein